MHLRMGEIITPKHVELIEIINKIIIASNWLFILTYTLYEKKRYSCDISLISC